MTDHEPGEDAEALAEENARLRADLEAAEAKTSEARKVGPARSAARSS